MKKNLIVIAVIGLIVGAIITIEYITKPVQRTAVDPSAAELVTPSLESSLAQKQSNSQNSPSPDPKAGTYPVAKDISTIDAFINTQPFTVQELIDQDKVVLIDFWTYSCINCQRTIPHLNSWHDKYADDGLVIVGVHTPEFEFEKKLENVQAAVDKWGIKYPVVLDNDYSTWSSYQNVYWPRKYLIDIDGYIVYDHIGEGAYDQTEEQIVKALNERKARLEQAKIEVKDSNVTDNTPERIPRTPETYLGSKRIEYIGNLADQACLTNVCDFGWSDQDTLPLDRYVLQGQWQITPEYSTNVQADASILIHFKAKKVNLVVANLSNPVQAQVYLDGELISSQYAGSDVIDGVVTFDEDDLFNLVDFGDTQGQHLLEIKPLAPGMQAFAFTFG